MNTIATDKKLHGCELRLQMNCTLLVIFWGIILLVDKENRSQLTLKINEGQIIGLFSSSSISSSDCESDLDLGQICFCCHNITPPPP